MAKQRLSPTAFAAMGNSLIDSDPTNQILIVWIAKEELRALLSLARTGACCDQIRARLHMFYTWCAALTSTSWIPSPPLWRPGGQR